MEHVLSYYLQVSQRLTRRFYNHFGELNLTFPQTLALSTLGAEGPMPISRLAEKTGSANSTISGIVDRLEKLGLARRTRSETDRRVIYVEVTPKYTQLRDEMKMDVNAHFDGLLDRLESKERQTILDGLKLLDKVLAE